MLRTLFDTNIYGKLAIEPDIKTLREQIENEKDFLVYGFDLIRKEIRNIPVSNPLARKNRILLLGLYDQITKQRSFSTTLQIQQLSKQYYARYMELGGAYGWDTNIHIDFSIVACASTHGLDIVYSDDKRTLASEKAIQAYTEINSRKNVRPPTFLNYAVLLKKFRGNL